MNAGRVWALAICIVWLLRGGCTPDRAEKPNPPDPVTNGDSVIKINDHPFEVWVADSEAEREQGLMFVTAEQMAPLPNGAERGMWFIFSSDQPTSHGFWMRNTIVPLDIAFVRADGTIVTIHTMAPLDERLYYPTAPYRYALEVNANVFSRLGVREGHHVEIPEALLKSSD